MLREITIKDFAIVDSLTVELEGGMTVITGETGAGKSIMLDALGLCLGDRADTRTVRPGAKKADISARFDLSRVPQAKSWLETRELQTDQDDCVVRRVVGADGRSKAFINGAQATLADCADLGELLVDLHSQHAHQSLLRGGVQRDLLDAYANAESSARMVYDLAHQHKAMAEEYDRLSGQSDTDTARRDLLAYQVSELDELALQDGEFSELETEYRILANAGFLLESTSSASEGCEQAQDLIGRLRQSLDDDRHQGNVINNIRELLISADIQLGEAQQDLRHYADSIELDPERLAQVDARLDRINRLARKHRVLPEALTEHHARLASELESLSGGDERLTELLTNLETLRANYRVAAQTLSKARAKAAKTLAARVMETLGQLGMAQCHFEIALAAVDKDDVNPRGQETVAFLVSTNAGTKAGPLGKIASGGELSRISLALQVAASDKVTAATMIFDEVDVGIGGGIAEVVGTLLRRLADRVQVICVTHLGQVAAQGTQHLQVAKTDSSAGTLTTLTRLDKEARVMEVARMVGGVELSKSSVAHAKDMLARAGTLH